MLTVNYRKKGEKRTIKGYGSAATTVHGHKYSSPSIFLLYISYKTTFFSKKYFKAISGQIFMKFISRHAEFFEFYMFI
jgi:hypothetical protein